MKILANKNNEKYYMADVIVLLLTVMVFFVYFVYYVINSIATNTFFGIMAYMQRAGVILLVLMPTILRKIGLIIPRFATLCLSSFLFLAVFLGTFMGLYIYTSWWDKFNHVLSGILLGFVGLFFLNSSAKNNDNVSSITIFMTVFAFAMMFGAVWEMWEYFGDGVFKMNMQKFMDDITKQEYMGRNALGDTMIDIYADAIGAIIAGITSILLYKRDKTFLNNFKISLEKNIKRDKIDE